MRRARGVVGGSVLVLLVACGGSAFTSNGDGNDGGTNGDGTTGGSGSGGGNSSGGTSSGGSSGSGSSSSGASSGGSSNGSGSNGGSSSGSSNGGGSGASSGASGGGSGGSGGSGSSSGSSSGGSSSGGTGPCPSSIPTATTGGSCSPAGLVCEYGDRVVQGCDTIATCGSSGGWTLQGPTLTDCGSNSSSCPATYSSVPKGSTCTPNGLVCNYLEGRCECTTGPGVIHLVDGSVVGSWYCQGPSTTGCPQRRPMLGSTCTLPNLSCNYGSCYIEGGTTETCTNGVWVATLTPCPG